MKNKQIIKIWKNNGKFYYVYQNDAFVINYLFNYKILDNNRVGFPETALNKVITLLEKEKINYQIIFNNEIINKKNYPKNKYLDYYHKAIKKVDDDKKIEYLLHKIASLNKKELDNLFEIIDHELK